jgi:hypothetical protein
MPPLVLTALSWGADWILASYDYNQRPGGLGRAWIPLMGLAVAGGIVLIRRRRLEVLGFVVLPAVVTLLTMPMAWYARLTLFVPAVAIPLASLAIDRIGTVRPRLATDIGIALVGLAAFSLAQTNLQPNINVSAAGVRPDSVSDYMGYVLDPDEARRSQVGFRADCAGFEVVPPGERVALGGFNLLHAVARPTMDRILGAEIRRAEDAADLAASMQAQGSLWLVVRPGSRLRGIAEAAPSRFVAYGHVCEDGELWRLR